MRAVERVDESVILDSCPAMRLHRTAQLKSKFVEVALPDILRNPPFAHQPPEIAVSAEVIEAVIVNPEMAHMGRHEPHRIGSSPFEEIPFPGGIELQNLRAVLKTLGPFCPHPARILALHRKHRRALGDIVFLLNEV